jgi:hypothetical protein
LCWVLEQEMSCFPILTAWLATSQEVDIVIWLVSLLCSALPSPLSLDGNVLDSFMCHILQAQASYKMLRPFNSTNDIDPWHARQTVNIMPSHFLSH